MLLLESPISCIKGVVSVLAAAAWVGHVWRLVAAEHPSASTKEGHSNEQQSCDKTDPRHRTKFGLIPIAAEAFTSNSKQGNHKDESEEGEEGRHEGEQGEDGRGEDACVLGQEGREEREEGEQGEDGSDGIPDHHLSEPDDDLGVP